MDEHKMPMPMASNGASSLETYQSNQKEFIARGLDARDKARKSDRYFSAKKVLMEMDTMLQAKVKQIKGNNQ